jgi:hypothetical protein
MKYQNTIPRSPLESQMGKCVTLVLPNGRTVVLDWNETQGGKPAYAGIYHLKSKEVRWLEVGDQAHLTAI